MSEPYEEKLYTCDRCAEDFTKEDMIEEGDFIYCKECFDMLLEMGDI